MCRSRACARASAVAWPADGVSSEEQADGDGEEHDDDEEYLGDAERRSGTAALVRIGRVGPSLW